MRGPFYDRRDFTEYSVPAAGNCPSRRHVTLEAFLELLIDEREELTAAIERADAHLMPLSEKQIEAKIERGLLQSERGEVVDGDAFTAGLLSEITEMERKRQVG